MSRLGNQYRRVHSAHEVGIVVDAKKENEEGLAHEGPYNMEEVQYIPGNKGYNFKPNNNLPTHHTLALRNDENLSYGGGVQQDQRPVQNHQQNYAPQGFQGQQYQGNHRAENQGQRRSQSFEDQILSFMGENKRLLNIHKKKFAELVMSVKLIYVLSSFHMLF